MYQPLTLIGSFRKGDVEGKVWKCEEYDAKGNLGKVFFDVELSRYGTICIEAFEFPNLLNVIWLTINAVRRHCDSKTEETLSQMLAGLREPVTSQS